MRHPVVRVVGYALTVPLILVLALEMALAIRRGHAFYGTNYKGLPLGVTYPIVAGVIVAGALVWIGVRRLLARKHRRRP